MNYRGWCQPWSTGWGSFVIVSTAELLYLLPFLFCTFWKSSHATPTYEVGSDTLLLEGRVSTQIIWSYSTWESCIFSPIYLLIQSFISLWIMDIYFIVLIKANTTYSFCCSNCSSFGHWELFLWLLSFWHNPIIVGFLSTVLLSGTARCSCLFPAPWVFPVPVPKSAISLGSLVPFIGEGY